ncbi:aldo/keto reductase [Allorhodopirellula solitaria]|uniref:General stress protein 69 n=1 Tax=Allorhodopirellula solitaria TaxID=2527987 RepID=A0A5C5YJW7_9BACT|nr:aldo/keto reductase [Allorhodopirellula solitaria]TWT75109.1 General stress protein 69 [Allorhodopirellula solitaria]
MPDCASNSPAPLFASEVVLGLWPISGVTTMGVTAEDAEATIATAIERGIRTFDTAYSYGMEGEADRYLASAMNGDTDRFHVISKVGQRYLSNGERIVDSRPATLRKDAEESLRRLRIDCFGTLMLHSIDEDVEIERSAEALLQVRDAGLARRIGLCNASESQRKRFDAVCDCRAIQCPLNLLQQENLGTVIADASEAACDVLVYWTLMKGLLAGKISPVHVFPAGDSRPGYAVFQGQQRDRAHRLIDELKRISTEVERSVAELAVSWALSQSGVTAALVGARRPDQIRDLASARPLEPALLHRIDHALVETEA